MAVTYNRVAGQVPVSKTSVYTVAASTAVTISHMVFNNTDASARNVQVWLNDGTSRRIINVSVPAGETLYASEHHILIATDQIEIQAAAGSVVDYWISLAEVT